MVLVIACLLFICCETNRNEVMAIGKKTIMPSTTGTDIIVLYSDSAKLKIKLLAPQMQIYEKEVKEKLTIMPKGVFVVFFDNNERQTTTLKADYGVRYENSQRMEAKYNVEVVNQQGEKLNTERLVWDEQKKKITSDAFVKITTAKQIILGKGMEANQDFTQYEIKEITGTINLEEHHL